MSRALRERGAALARQEERFRLVVERAPSAMVLVDEDGDISLANHRTERMFGYANGALVGRPFASLVSDVGSPGAAEERRRCIGRRKDGEELVIELELTPVHASGGTFTLGSMEDLTERARMTRWFERIVEAAPNAKVVIDWDGRITLVNAATERLFGFDREDLLGQPIERLVPERLRGAHVDHVQRFYRDPEARMMAAGRELFGVRKDGTEVPLEIGLAPIEAPEGLATLASVIDVTSRKRNEDELKRSNAELEQFAYVASHDLQEPLRMVANYTELLRQRYEGKLDADANKYIFFAVDGARRMQQLVSDLLAYSRVGSRGKPLRAVSLEDVTDSVVRSLGTLVEEAGAEVEHDSLPTVMADEVQLRQLVQNLVGNGIKFRSGSPPRIRIAARRRGARWLVSVADNGIGIDSRHGERVFQMFQRLHKRGEYEGSGIGLAIAKRIVQRHGGKIWFESTPGEGTTFFFTLPAVAEA